LSPVSFSTPSFLFWFLGYPQGSLLRSAADLKRRAVLLEEHLPMLSSSASCSRAFPHINATFRRITSPAITFRAGLMLLYVVTAPAWATNATTTTLAVTSAGSAVTTVTAGSVVTLMARVMLAASRSRPARWSSATPRRRAVQTSTCSECRSSRKPDRPP
jgi:hypothetical protein